MTKTSKTSPSLIQAETPLMTIPDIAQLERTSVRTTRRAIKAGLIEVIRIGPKGHLIRVTQEAYQAYRQRLAKRH